VATDRSGLSWTSTHVLSDVRRKASLPTTSTDWTDAVLLREATDVLRSFAGWALSQGGEGRLVSSLDRPVSAALSSSYRDSGEFLLPPLAVAHTIDSVVHLNDLGTTEIRLTRIDAAVQSDFDSPGTEGDPIAYALVGDRIRVYPAPSTGGTIRITYQRIHPDLVADTVANVGTLASFAAALTTPTTLLTMLAPTAITGVAVGDTLDLLSASYPYVPLVVSAEVLSVPDPLTLEIDQPVARLTGFDLGARIMRSGQSPYVALPLELRTCITEKTAANILRTLGDLQGMQASEQAATLELSRVMQMLNPRGKRDKPRAVNPYSHLRMRLGRG
jgi:hypothetical protein